MSKTFLKIWGIILLVALVCSPGCKKAGLKPARVIAELKIGESQDVKLNNG